MWAFWQCHYLGTKFQMFYLNLYSQNFFSFRNFILNSKLYFFACRQIHKTTKDYSVCLSIALHCSLPPFNCSKLTIETLKQGVKYVKSLLLKHQNDANETYFTPCSSASIVNFKHVITGWVVIKKKRLKSLSNNY